MGRLLDSNIVIDALNGIEAALALLIGSPDAAISVLTWMEVLAGTRTDHDERIARAMLSTLTTLPLTPAISEAAWRIRRDRRIKLVDAVIWAAARVHDLPLYTRNTKDFDPSDPSVVVPYTI